MASFLGQCQFRYHSFSSNQWASASSWCIRPCQFVDETLARMIQLHRLQVKQTRSDGKWNTCTEVTKEILILCNHLIQLYLRLVLCDGTFVCFNSPSCALKTRSKHSTIIGSISQSGKDIIEQNQYQNIRWTDKRIPRSARSSLFHLFPGHWELNLAIELKSLLRAT